ncbi:MAG: extracellular solute-binding protein, partial [Acutalibacteraceae bacterium]
MCKRIIAILMTAAMLFSLAACSGGTTESFITSEIYVDDEDAASTGSSNTDYSDATSGNSSGGSSSKTTGGNTASSASKIDTSKITTVDGLDFGGKTVKIAISDDKTPTESDKRMFADFEKAYNCKIKYDIIAFSDYLKTVGNKISSNQPYDILYLHGSMFPAAVISRIAVPLDDAIYEKDKLNKNNISAGGIDMDKSSYYTWKNQLYGVAGYDDVNIFFLYYNKQKFKDSGLEDPMTLYNSGKGPGKK